MLRTSLFGVRRPGTSGLHAAVARIGGSGVLILQHQQRRRFFFNSLSKLVNLRKLQDAVDGTTDDAKKVEYIKALVAYSPRTAMQQIERGWESGKLPVSDQVLKEYLKCAAELKKLDSVNVAGLMALVKSR